MVYSCRQYHWKLQPRGWALMAYMKRGKEVCRYFYTGAEDERR